MESITDRAVRWVVGKDTGISSEAIWAHMMNAAGNIDSHSHPRDPADLGRCLRLLRIIPEWRVRIREMAKYGPGWDGLVRHWHELEALMEEEAGIDWSKGRKAPKTYEAMNLAEAEGFRRSPEWECTFSEKGFLSTASKRKDTP